MQEHMDLERVEGAARWRSRASKQAERAVKVGLDPREPSCSNSRSRSRLGDNGWGPFRLFTSTAWHGKGKGLGVLVQQCSALRSLHLLVNASAIATVAQTCRGSGPLLTSSRGVLATWRAGSGTDSQRIGVGPRGRTRGNGPTTDVSRTQDQHFAIQGVRRLADMSYIRLNRVRTEGLKMDEMETEILREALADPTANPKSRVAPVVLWSGCDLDALALSQPLQSRGCSAEGETSVYKKRRLVCR